MTENTRLSSLADDPLLSDLAARFVSRGYEFVLAGGAVRNALLGMEVTDFDISTDAEPRRVAELVGSWADESWDAGNEVGTICCLKDGMTFDITTYRIPDYRPEGVQIPFFRRGIGGDLFCRDFRMNTVCLVFPEHEIFDPFNGIGQIAAGEISTPLPPRLTLDDRPLRMVRAARFVAKLGFTVAPELLAAMAERAETIRAARPQWLEYELNGLLSSAHAERGIEILDAAGVAAVLADMGWRLSGARPSVAPGASRAHRSDRKPSMVGLR